MPSQRERERVEREYLVQRQRQPEQPRYYPCGHLRPEPLPGRPDPPASECAACNAQAMGNRPAPAPKRRELTAPDPTTPAQWELLERYYEEHPEKRPGGGLTKVEEERLVAMADEARAEERAREQRAARHRDPFERRKIIFLGAGGVPDWRGSA